MKNKMNKTAKNNLGVLIFVMVINIGVSILYGLKTGVFFSLAFLIGFLTNNQIKGESK